MATVKFCPDCKNMLYPREEKSEKKLLFACRNCEHQEEAETLLIYRHQIKHLTSEEMAVQPDLALDPTLPRTKTFPCPKCGNKEAVYFQSRARRADTTMQLYYVCCNLQCGHRYVDDRVFQNAPVSSSSLMF